MFDNIISSVQGFAMNILWFAVAGLVGSAIYQVYPGGMEGGFDFMFSVKIAANGAAAALTTSLIMGATKG